MRLFLRIKGCVFIVLINACISHADELSEAEAEVRRLKAELKIAEMRLAALASDQHVEEKELDEGGRGEEAGGLHRVVDPGESSVDPLTNFFDDLRLSVRYSAFDQSTIQDPAKLQFLLPSDGDDSYSIDVGATWNLTELIGNSILSDGETIGLFDISLLAEYHRNTETDSRKDTFIAGGLLTSHIGDVSSDRWIHYFDVKGAYKRDKINTGEGFLGEIAYWPLIARPFGSSYEFPNIGGYWGPEWFVLSMQPGFAVQFEEADNIDKSGRGGDTWRGKMNLKLAAYPFASWLEREPDSEIGPLELSASYVYWDNWSASGGFEARENHHDMWKTSLNYYFGSFNVDLEQRPFAIGIDYVDGENPEEGFDDDNYWQLGFKFMF